MRLPASRGAGTARCVGVRAGSRGVRRRRGGGGPGRRRRRRGLVRAGVAPARGGRRSVGVVHGRPGMPGPARRRPGWWAAAPGRSGCGGRPVDGVLARPSDRLGVAQPRHRRPRAGSSNAASLAPSPATRPAPTAVPASFGVALPARSAAPKYQRAIPISSTTTDVDEHQQEALDQRVAAVDQDVLDAGDLGAVEQEVAVGHRDEQDQRRLHDRGEDAGLADREHRGHTADDVAARRRRWSAPVCRIPRRTRMPAAVGRRRDAEPRPTTAHRECSGAPSDARPPPSTSPAVLTHVDRTGCSREGDCQRACSRSMSLLLDSGPCEPEPWNRRPAERR